MSKNKKPNLTPDAQRRLDLGSQMMSKVLEQGGVPEIVIGARVTNKEMHALDYFIVSPLERDKILYVLSRVVGLLDGSIRKGN